MTRGKVAKGSSHKLSICLSQVYKCSMRIRGRRDTVTRHRPQVSRRGTTTACMSWLQMSGRLSLDRLNLSIPKLQLIPEALVHQPIRQAMVLRSVLPLAAVSGMGAFNNPMAIILPSFCNAVSNFVKMYSFLIIFRIFLTWFPNFNWRIEPFHTITQLTDPFLNVFRGLLPPVANIDFTPIFGIMVLNWVAAVLDSSNIADSAADLLSDEYTSMQKDLGDGAF